MNTIKRATQYYFKVLSKITYKNNK